MASIAASGVALGTLSGGVSSAGTAPPDSTVPETTGAPDATTASGSTASSPAAAGGLALDSAFGADGVLPANVNDAGHDRFISVVSAADGSVFASGFTDVGDGDHAVVVSKFTAGGALDESYGEGGTAVVNVVEGGGDAEV